MSLIYIQFSYRLNPDKHNATSITLDAWGITPDSICDISDCQSKHWGANKGLIYIYAIFAMAASIICSVLAAVVYFFNRKGQLNQVFIYTIVFGAYAAFTTFMVITADSSQTAYLWNKIGFLWPFFLVLLLQFILVFTENHLATDKRQYLLLYVSAAIFALLDLTTDYISGLPVNTLYGYIFNGADSLLRVATSLWSATISMTSVFLCLRYYFKVKDENKKQQAKLISIGITYPIILTALSKAAISLLGWYIPYYSVGANSLLCVLVVYAIWKYDLFNLNPAIAAENIIATMPDSFILTDSEGKILRANSALTNLLGYKENELTGKNISQLFTNKFSSELIKNTTPKQEIKNHETQIRTKSVTQKPVSVSASLIKSKRGKPIGITLIIHDLTRRKQNEEKILKTERFAAIGELAGMIGHDLRNPLTSIQAATYYLKKKNAKTMDDTSKEMLKTIETSIQYSNKIINDLLDYSREITLKTEEATAKSLLANALALVPVPTNVKLVDLTQVTPILQVDKVNMSRVFVNILKNAFEAMPDSGTLTVKSIQAEDSMEISFGDTGIGMTQQIIDRLWTPLFTTKAKGMGFGLPICKRIVEAHGGKIQVKSIHDKGTTFTITLPLNTPLPTQLVSSQHI